MSFIAKIIGTLLPSIGSAIEEAVTDKDEARRLKAEITHKLLSLRDSELDAAKSIIVAEAQGESWLQRNWRPILMLTIVAIVANNYILVPYLTLFGLPAETLELPSELFNLMTVGVGGYVVGRSGEKIMAKYKE